MAKQLSYEGRGHVSLKYLETKEGKFINDLPAENNKFIACIQNIIIIITII